jgi:hypothetical protein
MWACLSPTRRELTCPQSPRWSLHPRAARVRRMCCSPLSGWCLTTVLTQKMRGAQAAAHDSRSSEAWTDVSCARAYPTHHLAPSELQPMAREVTLTNQPHCGRNGLSPPPPPLPPPPPPPLLPLLSLPHGCIFSALVAYSLGVCSCCGFDRESLWVMWADCLSVCRQKSGVVVGKRAKFLDSHLPVLVVMVYLEMNDKIVGSTQVHQWSPLISQQQLAERSKAWRPSSTRSSGMRRSRPSTPSR